MNITCSSNINLHNFFFLLFDSSNSIRFIINEDLNNTQQMRDLSAWYERICSIQSDGVNNYIHAVLALYASTNISIQQKKNLQIPNSTYNIIYVDIGRHNSHFFKYIRTYAFVYIQKIS